MVNGSVEIDQDRCKGCSLCVLFCPQSVLEINPVQLNARGYHPAALVAEGCTGCGVCAVICPDVCITVYREQRSGAKMPRTAVPEGR